MVSSTRGLADEHLLEAALERGVLLDVLAVLVERGGADHAQLAAGEHGLEHVAGVHGALAAAPAPTTVCSSSMKVMICAVGVLDLLEHRLEPLLELAAVLRAGDHRAEVERDQLLAAQRLGHVAGDDALGQPLDDGGLADAGLADEHRVVLGAPRQHLDDPADLAVAADDRVDLPVAGARGEVDAVLLQRLEGALRIGTRDPGGAAHRLRAHRERGRGDASVREQVATSPPCWASAMSRCSVETYSSLRSRASRSAALSTARKARDGCGAPTDAPEADGKRSTSCEAAARRCSGSTPNRREQRPGQPLGVVEQRDGQVRGLRRGVTPLGGRSYRGGNRLLAAGGQIHGCPLLLRSIFSHPSQRPTS